jgi:hypothetical protein
MNKPDLNTPRMGYESNPYFYKVNLLFGLDELCKDINLNKTSIIMELGSYNGVSTSLFAFYCFKVYAVDVWNSPELILNVIPKYNNIEFIVGSTKDIVPTFSDKFFDAIYIDADHSYEGVKLDILNSISKIKPGGYLCGHDYDEIKKNDVYRAVNEQFGAPDKVYEDQSWMIKL